MVRKTSLATIVTALLVLISIPSVLAPNGGIQTELYDLQQKAVNMQDFLTKFNQEFADMKSIAQNVIDIINEVDDEGDFAEEEAIAHLQNLLDYIQLIEMQKSDLHDLVSDFDSELDPFGENACSEFPELCVEGGQLFILLSSLQAFVDSEDDIHDELGIINEILFDGGFPADVPCEGNDLADYINCAINHIENEDAENAIDVLQNGVIAAINAADAEKKNIENNKVDEIKSLLEDIENIIGDPVPPPFNPNTIVFDDLQGALFDVDAKAEELEGILVDIDEELVEMRDVIADAKTAIEEGIALLPDDEFAADEKFKEAIRLIIRAETIKHIITGPFVCNQAECVLCGGEGCSDGIKVQEFEELKSEIEDELNNDIAEGEGSVSVLCGSGFIDDRRCNKFFRALSSMFDVLEFINEELSEIRFNILSSADEDFDDAINDLENAIDSGNGEDAASGLDRLDDGSELIEQAIIRKEFIENQKMDKLDFFLNQIVDDVGTQEDDPLNEILLDDVKEEWFNIQVKLIWLNDLLKGLNEQIGFAEEDLENIIFLFDECNQEGAPEECPDSEPEFISVLLNNIVNSIVRVILALVDVEEIENLIDDIREEKAAVEQQISILCGEDAIDNERICNKLQRKLTGMNKALDYIDEELEEVVDELGNALDNLFDFLFFVLGEIGLFSDAPPEISSDNYVQVIEQLYQTLGQAVSNGISAPSFTPTQFEDLEEAIDSIRNAKSIKETIELHKFPVLFERFRSFEETIGGSVKSERVLENMGGEAEEARHIQTKVLKMFSLLHLINVHAANLKKDLLADDCCDEEDFAIFEKLNALEDVKSELESEISDLEFQILEAIGDGDIDEFTGNHILRNIDKIQSLSGLINIEFFIMEILFSGFANTCCGEDSFIFLTLFIAEKEAIELKKLPELEASLVEIENALIGCDDDDHDELFENPFCFRNCGFKDHCGDGKVQFALGEQCDDGNNVNTDACTNECKAPACGDGIVQAGEECDDGNKADGDSCSSDCLIPDPDGDGICDNGDSILPCQWNQDCGNLLSVDTFECGVGGACINPFENGHCECPGLKCDESDDCVGKIDCSSIGSSCSVPGNCESCVVGECSCSE